MYCATSHGIRVDLWWGYDDKGLGNESVASKGEF